MNNDHPHFHQSDSSNIEKLSRKTKAFSEPYSIAMRFHDISCNEYFFGSSFDQYKANSNFKSFPVLRAFCRTKVEVFQNKFCPNGWANPPLIERHLCLLFVYLMSFKCLYHPMNRHSLILLDTAFTLKEHSYKTNHVVEVESLWSRNCCIVLITCSIAPNSNHLQECVCLGALFTQSLPNMHSSTQDAKALTYFQ